VFTTGVFADDVAVHYNRDMNWLVLIVTLLPAAVPELTTRQSMILEDTDDRSSTIDAAGLYALLDNAQAWPTDPAEAEAGQRLIDYEALREAPEVWRGEPLVLEGVLESISNASLYTPNRFLARDDWQGLEAWHVRGPNDVIYIVMLTDPPAVATQAQIGGHRIPETVDQPVRVVGRFYKLITVANQSGEARRYAVFVGKAARFTGAPVAPARDGNGAPMLAPSLMLVVLLVAAYGLIRLSMRRKKPSIRERFAEHRVPEEHEEAIEYRSDLPTDPVAALAALQSETDASPDESKPNPSGTN